MAEALAKVGAAVNAHCSQVALRWVAAALPTPAGQAPDFLGADFA